MYVLNETKLKIENLRTQYSLHIKLLGIPFSPAAAAVYSIYINKIATTTTQDDNLSTDSNTIIGVS